MRTRLVTVLLALITAILVIPGPVATADEQGGESLMGQIGQPDDRDQGVEGIQVTVFDGDDEVGTGETDSDGDWEVEVPGPGTYRLVVDQGSLPDAYTVRETQLVVDGEAEVEVENGAQRVLIVLDDAQTAAENESETDSPSPDDPATEEDQEDEEAAADDESLQIEGVSGGFGERFVQLTVVGLLFGLVIAISAIGLSLIFGTTSSSTSRTVTWSPSAR